MLEGWTFYAEEGSSWECSPFVKNIQKTINTNIPIVRNLGTNKFYTSMWVW